MPNTRYYNLTEASRTLNVRQVKLFNLLKQYGIPVTKGTYISADQLAIVQAYQKRVSNG